MMKNFTVLIALAFLSAATLTAQSSLEGKVIDAETGEPVILATVALYKNDVLITGTETDFDGNYAFSNIDPGTYDVEASYVGAQTKRIEGVVVLAGKAVKLDVEMSSGVVLEEVEIVDYIVPLIEQDNTTTGGIKTAEQIRNLPQKDIQALAATTAGLSSIDGEDISIRGSRTDATYYYIDGIRVNNSNLIPQSEIDQLQVITGGIEAQYGDVTGGIISITTKGPSNAYSGGLEVESSEFLDPYGYNLISGNFSGPILRKNGRSIVGFRLSGQFRNRKDDDPAFGRYRATSDVIGQLEEDPLRRVSGTILNSAEFLEEGDVEFMDSRPNNEITQLDLTAKLDARLSSNVDITLSGSYQDAENIFNPNEAWALLNWTNNPLATDTRYRMNFRFKHRLEGNPVEKSGTREAAKSSVIRNAAYTLQFGYEKNKGTTEDVRHGDNVFNYGYVGSFENEWIPAAGESQYSGAELIGNVFVAHSGYAQQFLGWTPGTINPTLARYNELLGDDVPSMTQYIAYNGFRSTNYSTTWFGIHNNVGSVYNLYQFENNDRYTFSATSSFDLVPGGSDKGRHNIQFGILYEQRINRDWRVAPFGLWTLARLQANAHIIGVDTNTVIGTFMDTINNVPYEFEQFQTLINDDSNLLFFRNVREITGHSNFEYVNIDGIDPSALSLDMFAPKELNDQDIISYYGYDYLGNQLSNDVTFDDFFTDRDEEGRLRFTVAPDKPIYTAAYIQDKFTFKDIIFRLGLRVDRFDANTKVLKDPLSLYPIMTATDFYAQGGPGASEEVPPNVGDDFAVYVDAPGSTSVKAFRDGEQWYNEIGTPVNDGNVIFGGELVTPYYVEQDIARRNIKSSLFDPDGSFEDYTPQVNWMPRLAFSFPISDEANFFAHYDILVQRPPSNNRASALDYYYFEEDAPSNNPNLKPETTIDYEVGFKQKLTNSSAITLSAYYKELRDMIQVRTYLYVPPPVNQYESFGNLDFGTVKGFSVAYDLRRTNNLELTANYTLQFADGTGSEATSQRGLTDRGNIRALFPLSFDERHRLVANVDYRYASGRAYNGPRILGADIFANAGIGFQVTAVSGRPYSRRQKPEPFSGTGFAGAINGARLPWNFTIDLRANKQFRVLVGNEDTGKPLFVNVYLRVQNLLDARNVINVYSASGSAEDDGFIASPDGQSALNTLNTSGRDVAAFLRSYQWRMFNADFYTLPRRMYLGAIVEF